jgi:hypothetical protein
MSGLEYFNNTAKRHPDKRQAGLLTSRCFALHGACAQKHGTAKHKRIRHVIEKLVFGRKLEPRCVNPRLLVAYVGELRN